MNISFRTADISDENDGRHVLDLLDRFSSESSFPRKMPEETKRTLIQNMQAFPTTQVYFAEDKGEPVGIAVCFNIFSTFRNAPVMNLHDFYIRKDYQNKGLGKQFLSYLETVAIENGCVRIMLEVYKYNTPAATLYEKMGYAGGEHDAPNHIMYALSKEL